MWVYLDDILVVNTSKKALHSQKTCILEDLKNLGLNINPKKSILEPLHEVDYLGFHLNFVTGHLDVPKQ